MNNYVIMRNEEKMIVKIECFPDEIVTKPEIIEKIKNFDSDKNSRFPELVNNDLTIEILEYLFPKTEDQITDKTLQDQVNRLTSIIENIRDETWRM